MTRRETFDNLDYWKNEIDMYCSRPGIVMLLVANKCDLIQPSEDHVTKEEATKWARRHSMMFMECSAKTTLGIQQAFEEIAHKVIEGRNVGGDAGGVHANRVVLESASGAPSGAAGGCAYC